jgi:hypothetical protein
VTRSILPPSTERSVSQLNVRVTNLERVLRRQAEALAVAASGVVLNLRGQVTAVATDRIYPPPPIAPLVPQGFHASLSAYAGGLVRVELRRNGATVVALDPTASPVYEDISATWDADDYAEIVVTSWAAGARGLVARLV